MVTIDWWRVGYRERIGDSYYWSQHNSAGGVDVYIAFRNKGEKTIKYVVFTVIPKNAVGDVVECEISGKSTANLKFTGPLAPNSISGGGWVSWGTVWYNYTLTTAVMTKIQIEYMDGTTEEQEFIATPKEELKTGGCYVATCVYGSYDCPEVWTLRRFRDNCLAKNFWGRAFIRVYYAISPSLVKWFGRTEWFKKMWKTPLDLMVKKLRTKGMESTPYNDKL